MTKQEAVRLIRNLPTMCEFTDAYGDPIDSEAYYEAVNMAISALQAQEAKHSTYEQGEKMNRQRKVVITVTYNDLGVIVDTKAEELDSSAQPNLQPTCNNLATDAISRQAAIDVLKGLPTWWADEGGYYGEAQPPMVALFDPEDAVSAIENLPSAHPELCKDAVSRQRLLSDLKELVAAWKKHPVMAEQIKGVETAIGYVESIPSVKPTETEGES